APAGPERVPPSGDSGPVEPARDREGQGPGRRRRPAAAGGHRAFRGAGLDSSPGVSPHHGADRPRSDRARDLLRYTGGELRDRDGDGVGDNCDPVDVRTRFSVMSEPGEPIWGGASTLLYSAAAAFSTRVDSERPGPVIDAQGRAIQDFRVVTTVAGGGTGGQG